MLILLSGIDRCFAQQVNDFSRIDAFALGVPNSEASSVDRLAAALAKGAGNDREKARLIYRWITKNISYDTHAFFKGTFGDMSADNVLKTRKGICDGYAQLFAALAQSMGLEAERVVGNSKGYGYTVGSKIEGPANHAWNAVNVDGVWQLVDCTWGAGYIDPNKEFVERFSDYYFLTPPDQFVYDHFPDDPQKQLLSPPISKQAYENLADVRPLFFVAGLKLISHREGIIHADKRIDITIGAPANVKLMLQLLQDEQVQDPSLTYTYRADDEATLTSLFPSSGVYILRLFVKQRDDPGRQFEKALDYEINVGEPTSEAVRFPTFFEAFDDYGFQLKSNAERETHVGRNTVVELTSAPDVNVFASLQRNGDQLRDGYTFVEGQKGDHIVRVLFPQPGKYVLTLFAKRMSETGNYNAVLKYSFVSMAMKDPSACFPIVYEEYRDFHAQLFSPLDGRLEAGIPRDYKIQVPNAEAVAVVSNGQWTNLQKVDDVFQGTVRIGPGKAEVYARFPGNKQFVGLLRYQGVP